jgi:hypothetical protein
MTVVVLLAQASACVYPDGKRPLPAVRLTYTCGPVSSQAHLLFVSILRVFSLAGRSKPDGWERTLPVRIDTGGRLRQ